MAKKKLKQKIKKIEKIKSAKGKKILVKKPKQKPKKRSASLRAAAKQSRVRAKKYRLPRRPYRTFGLRAPRNDKKEDVKKISKPIKAIKIKPAKEKKILKPVKIKNKNPVAEILEMPAQPLFKAKIKVVGIGGGGSAIVSDIGKSLERASFLIADTDSRSLKKRSAVKSLLFGQELTHGMGTGVNVELAKKAAEFSKEKIAESLKGQDIIIFISSLGGGMGSGATQIFADKAKELGAITVGIFTLPFKFEGRNKYNIAQTAFKALKQSLNVSFAIPNEKIFKIINENTPITEAFSLVNKSLVESLESLIDLIFTPGIINIDFADLRAILSGIGNSAFLNTAEESGKGRAEKICQKIFKNPLAQISGLKAEKVLFNISGSESLSMLEVEKISRHVGEANPEAKIIFGISKNQKLKNKIKVTILTAGGGRPESAKPKKLEFKKEEITKVHMPALKTKKEILVPKKLQDAPRKPALAAGQKDQEEHLPDNLELKKSVLKKNAKKIRHKQIKKPIEAPSIFAGSEPVFSRREAIRRNGLEIKEAEQEAEKKKSEQEKEWEIPAFLRRVKFKS